MSFLRFIFQATKQGVVNSFLKVKYFGRPVKFSYRSSISPRSTLNLFNGGRIEIGKGCFIMDYAMILSYGGNIKIGDRVSVNPFTILYGHGGLEIGNDVLIAAHTVIIPANHTFSSRKLIRTQHATAKGIKIGDDVWIGANCAILDGVTVGKGCVIGAGSVVTKSLPPYSVVVGNPAKILYKRRAQDKSHR